MTPQEPQATTTRSITVNIWREWRRGRLLWDALDVIAALRAIGATDTAEQFTGMYERIAKRDGQS